MTWADAAPTVSAAVSTLIIWGFSRVQTKEVKSTTETESSKIQLRVDQKTDSAANFVNSQSHESIEDLKAMVIDLRIAVSERMDAQDMKLGHLSRNAFAISKKVGSEWTEEVTTIKGDKS